MNKQLWLLGILFHCWMASSVAQKPALFYRAGIEIGGAISSFVPRTVDVPIYNNRLGGRLGLYFMHRLRKSLDLRTGIFYTLRGVAFQDQQNLYNQDRFWNLHNLSTPIMLFYHLSDRVNVALGVELNANVDSNVPVIYYSSFDIGIRGSCGFYITPSCRIAAYYTHGLTDYWLPENSVGSNNNISLNPYKNIIAGISISFELHHRRDYSGAPPFKHPCPRL